MGKSLKGKELGTGISQRSDGLYMGRITDRNGNRLSKNFKKLQECRKWVADMQFVKEHGNVLRGDNPTVEIWFEYWYEKIKKPFWKPNTQTSNLVRWEKHIKPVIGNMLIQDVKPIHCNEIFDIMRKKGLKKNTMQGVKELMHGLFESAVENSFITFNPVTRNVKIPSKEEKKMRCLTVQEQKEFLERIKDTANYNFYAFALQTGMRVSEILALTWDDVDFSKNIISVNKTMYQDVDRKIKVGSPKSQTSIRKIPMTGEAKRLLISQKEKNSQLKVMDFRYANHVFLNTHGRLNTRNSVNSLLREYCKKYNVESFSMHSLRHTYATRCIEAGIRPKTLQVIMGHSSINITMNLYVHTTDEANKIEILKLENYLKIV